MIREYKRLVRFVIPHLWVLTLASLCMIASSAFSGVSIGMIIPLVDNIIVGKKIVIPHVDLLPAFIKALVETVNSMSNRPS